MYEEITSHTSCSNTRRHMHIVCTAEPDIQSLAASLLLKNKYMLLDPEANPKNSWKIYRTRRKRVIREHFVRYGKYTCCYCKRDDLTEDVGESNPRRLTVDHKTPVSRGGSLTAKNNMVICCRRCNNKKADTDYRSYLKIGES